MNKGMQCKVRAAIAMVALFACTAFAPANNKTVGDFSLRNTDRQMVSLKDFPEAKGFIIVFTCNHCPFARLYPPRLNAMNAVYSRQGVPLIAISSSDTVLYEDDSYTRMVAKAKDEHFNFPYLMDDMQQVAKNFGAQKTPHAFVIWRQDGKWVIKYNGAIDDNGAEPDKVTRHYVADAVDQLLMGKPVALKETKSIGCQISMRK